MGNLCGGPVSAEDRLAKQQSDAIDKQLKKDKDTIENTIKILLLGMLLACAANSGCCFLYRFTFVPFLLPGLKAPENRGRVRL
jgi:hypothetical protein